MKATICLLIVLIACAQAKFYKPEILKESSNELKTFATLPINGKTFNLKTLLDLNDVKAIDKIFDEAYELGTLNLTKESAALPEKSLKVTARELKHIAINEDVMSFYFLANLESDDKIEFKFNVTLFKNITSGRSSVVASTKRINAIIVDPFPALKIWNFEVCDISKRNTEHWNATARDQEFIKEVIFEALEKVAPELRVSKKIYEGDLTLSGFDKYGAKVNACKGVMKYSGFELFLSNINGDQYELEMEVVKNIIDSSEKVSTYVKVKNATYFNLWPSMSTPVAVNVVEKTDRYDTPAKGLENILNKNEFAEEAFKEALDDLYERNDYTYLRFDEHLLTGVEVKGLWATYIFRVKEDSKDEKFGTVKVVCDWDNYGRQDRSLGVGYMKCRSAEYDGLKKKTSKEEKNKPIWG